MDHAEIKVSVVLQTFWGPWGKICSSLPQFLQQLLEAAHPLARGPSPLSRASSHIVLTPTSVASSPLILQLPSTYKDPCDHNGDHPR